ncbi:ABC transporter substrate-binding protein [Mycolicibacterium litorale]|uniref:ABC transporter substrate-binding protein n=1 Tax=Mycolicibacterium litorale TaxID=758802 RepID=UPI001E5A2268|nr:ABC transporter substrate-binding protein [Mycolicibacterium litorale]
MKSRVVALSTLLVLLVSTACGGGAPGAPAPSQAAEGFPVTVDNCGAAVTVDRPPARVVGYFQHSVELLLALGLRDAVAATVYPDNPPLARYAHDYRSIPQISVKDASFEQILAVGPDFVYGGYGSAFDEAQGRSRQAFADAGIATYLNREHCARQPITMDDVYEEVRTVGRIFGVADRAEEVVTDMSRHVGDATARVAGVRPVKVFVYDSGDATAFTAGGQGIGNQVIELAGGTNIFGDVPETFADVSWEQVIERAPDVIVIYDYYGTPSVEEKKAALRARPELSTVPAIRDDRFAVLTLQDAVLGVRAPYAVGALAEQLHPER